MRILAPQLSDPVYCFKQPHDGPKVMVHCMEPKDHPRSVPHSWEKAGYTRDGYYKVVP